MQRINSNDGFFHDGDPFNGVQGTMVTADWLNAAQEEIATVIAAAGLALDPAQHDQLLEALVTVFATLQSPEFTGTPKAPTPPTNDNSTRIATTAHVKAAIAAVPGVPDFLLMAHGVI
jgi:hypothetical protein